MPSPSTRSGVSSDGPSAAAREAAGISMRALAARCGLSQPFLSAVERGLSMPSIATLYRIAEALEVAPSTLLPDESHGDVQVIRAGEGPLVPSSERAGLGRRAGRAVRRRPGPRGLRVRHRRRPPTSTSGTPTTAARSCTSSRAGCASSSTATTTSTWGPATAWCTRPASRTAGASRATPRCACSSSCSATRPDRAFAQRRRAAPAAAARTLSPRAGAAGRRPSRRRGGPG